VLQLETQKVRNALHMDLASIKKHLERFKKMDVNGDGVLDIEEFERGLGFAEPSPVIRNLFSLLDVDESGLLPTEDGFLIK
jgi:Ca2+-binding EF-hand superfamily protein